MKTRPKVSSQGSFIFRISVLDCGASRVRSGDVIAIVSAATQNRFVPAKVVQPRSLRVFGS